eukprot:TRINITY_DN360_c0_g1_i26.p1 TRINITY_DN360_c0_g1~~TRINITY_DN360_c0_g1_i26.p1  ORF type:complete len:607 (+),score=41.90 TRINITY_DN360_c0_g1_i26:937-2757(+)
MRIQRMNILCFFPTQSGQPKINQRYTIQYLLKELKQSLNRQPKLRFSLMSCTRLEELLFPNESQDFHFLPNFPTTFPHVLWYQRRVHGDLHLYIRFTNESQSSYLAYASACVLDGTTSRPRFGRVNYNQYYMQSTNLSDAKVFIDNVAVAIHEITHVLGFSSGLIGNWIDPQTNKTYSPTPIISSTIRGYSMNLINSSTVLSIAQAHYNCSSIQGMQLENQGGSGSLGSHWERAVLQDEYMTSSQISTQAIYSNFTLALLKDTGWYSVNLSQADPIMWGKNKGCSFFESACDAETTFTEFQSPVNNTNGEGCTFDSIGWGTYSNETYSDTCHYIQKYSNTDCANENDLANIANAQFTNTTISPVYFGYNSRCFSSNLIYSQFIVPKINETFRCLKYQCSDNNSLLNIFVGDTSYECSDGGEISQGSYVIGTLKYIGQIQCPSSVYDFCSQARPCPNHCSGKGFCLQNQCHCVTGYKGSDCSQLSCTASNCLTCDSSDATVCKICNNTAGYYLNTTSLCEYCDISDQHYASGSVCYTCIDNCAYCTMASSCKQCMDGYYIQYYNNMQNQRCVSTCGSQTYVDSSKTCQNCTTGCNNIIKFHQLPVTM